jgi:histidine ammonia-lyase
LKDRKQLRAGRGTEVAYQFVRKNIKHLNRDRVLYNDIQKALRLILDGSILPIVEKRVGKLD